MKESCERRREGPVPPADPGRLARPVKESCERRREGPVPPADPGRCRSLLSEGTSGLPDEPAGVRKTESRRPFANKTSSPAGRAGRGPRKESKRHFANKTSSPAGRAGRGRQEGSNGMPVQGWTGRNAHPTGWAQKDARPVSRPCRFSVAQSDVAVTRRRAPAEPGRWRSCCCSGQNWWPTASGRRPR